MKPSYLLLSLLFSVAAAQVDLSGKTQYYAQGLTDAFHLADLITPVSYTYTSYSDTSICITDGTCDTPSAIQAYTITYAGQGTVHACICDNPVFDIAYMAENVGRVPVVMRQTVISYTAASIGQGGGAYTSAAQIAFFDQDENTEVFIHESAHAYDGSYNPGLSQSSVYINDIETDACVPDSYASTNQVEDYAQLTVSWVYYAITGSPVPSCLSNSISYLMQVLPKNDILSSYANTQPSTSAPATSAPVTSAPSTSAPATSAPTPTSCTVGVRQTLTNSWESNGIAYSQYDVVFTNNGAQAVSPAVSLLAQLTQIWNLVQQKDGEFELPSYQPSIAPGAQFSWGYVVQGSSPISIIFATPASCSASATSAPTSAPATSAPATSAPATSAPVTSAPSTSAPATSAPATSAPSTCSFEVEQTLGSTWTSNGATFVQLNVVFTNANSVAASPVARLGSGIQQIWNLDLESDGYYHLPSYQASLAPGQQYSWGYIAEASSALTISFVC